MEDPRIIKMTEKKLIGIRMRTSLSENKTGILWHNFMKKRKEVLNRVDQDLYSVQIFDEGLTMESFTPDTLFEKWAAVEVSRFENIPDGMRSLKIPDGLYAVFEHKGETGIFHGTLQYIFSRWIPDSTYQVDHRPHFEIMGANYLGPENPESVEEVWIPIKDKN